MAEAVNRRREGRSRLADYNINRLAIRQMLNDADKDSDPVSIVVLTGGPVGDDLRADGAIVILKGGDTVALFCQWATRNRVLTRGKPIIDKPEEP